MKYIHSLDTLRLFSFLIVLIGHITLFMGLNIKPFYIADIGVYIFFVLSGFLITSIILGQNEFEKFSLKNFYIKRIKRIFPLYFLILFIGLVISTISVQVFAEGYTITNTIPLYRYLTFSFNFLDFSKNTLILSILWSICVEEQFYWFYPLVFKILKKQKYLIIFLIILLLISFISKIIFFQNMNFIYYNTLSVMNYLIAGSLLATAYFNKKVFLEKLISKSLFLISSLVFILIVIFRHNYLLGAKYSELTISIVLSILISIILLGFIKYKNNKILNFKIFTYLGKVSYGLYIYHILAFYFSLLIIKYFSLSNLYNIPVAIILSISLAIISYEKFERKILGR